MAVGEWIAAGGAGGAGAAGAAGEPRRRYRLRRR